MFYEQMQRVKGGKNTEKYILRFSNMLEETPLGVETVVETLGM